MSFFLSDPPDFAAHNADVTRVWDAYHAGRPVRVPVSVTGSITNYLLNPQLNEAGWTFQAFFEDPRVQMQAQLAYQKWQRFNLLCDREMGLPNDGWTVGVDFQNSIGAGWLNCPLIYPEGEVPDTLPVLREHKERLYDWPAEMPFNHGLMGRVIEFQEYMLEAAGRMEFEGRPVCVSPRLCGEDVAGGPFVTATKVRGADGLLLDMLTDEGYYHDLMGYITENTIRRMKEFRLRRWRRFPDSPDKGQFRRPGFHFGDDAIALISADQYREFVFPYHKRLVDEFSDGSAVSIHLCGDATRHFKFLKQRLNARSFDTGFPVDHGWLRRELGPEVQIQGGPTVMAIKAGPPEAIRAEVRRICRSGVMDGGRFIMIAANNLAPRTPVEHVRALYEATKEYGRYESAGPR